MEINNKSFKLTLYNDKKSSFEYIVASLIEFCNHTPIQAEQCAIIAHNKGKCDVISGDFFDIWYLKGRFDKLNIKSEIEERESNMCK